MVFNAALFIVLFIYIRKWRPFLRSGSISHWFLVLSSIVYLISYPLAFLSGKSYPHYFMLLMVPFIFIIGYLARQSVSGKLVLSCTIVAAVYLNFRSLPFDTRKAAGTRDAAAYIKSHSTVSDKILVTGFGNQVLHVMADRLSPTRFVMPLKESSGFTPAYQKQLTGDLQENPPVFIVVSKHSHHKTDHRSFYATTITKLLVQYRVIYENGFFSIYTWKNLSG
jgi:hypothetical protein